MAYLNMDEIANRAISDLDAIKSITNIAEQIIASKDEEIAKLNKKIIKLENKKIRLKKKCRILEYKLNLQLKLQESDDTNQSTENSDDTDVDDINPSEAESIWYQRQNNI